MLRSVEKTAPTVEAAIEAALLELGLPREAVEIDILQPEDQTGTGRPSCVLVTECAPQAQGGEGEASAAHATWAELTDESSLYDALEATEAFLTRVLDTFDLPYTLKMRIEDQAVWAEIDSKRAAVLIGRGGETLQALQYMATLVAHQACEGFCPVHVDISGYRARQQDKLANLARRTAASVVRAQRIFEMNPMSPADRRIIHAALQEFEGVTTHSEGEGALRHVVIAPVAHDA